MNTDAVLPLKPELPKFDNIRIRYFKGSNVWMITLWDDEKNVQNYTCFSYEEMLKNLNKEMGK